MEVLKLIQELLKQDINNKVYIINKNDELIEAKGVILYEKKVFIQI